MAESTNGDHDNTPNELEAKIIRQIEYYFSDHNLGHDKFLKEQIQMDDGWIPLDVLVKFNRLKTLSTDFKIIIDALKKSSANLIEIKEEEFKIRRSVEKPLPENTDEYRQQVDSRTVHVKRFPLEYELEQLLEYFKTVGEVENITMCRKNKTFKGSVFATFKTKEEAEEFVKKEVVKHGETELVRELRSDYHKRKQEEFVAIKEERKKIKLEQLEKAQKAKNEMEEDDEDVEIIKDSVIKLVGMHNKTTREAIKEVFSEYDTIAWVDSSLGDTEGFVRFVAEGCGREVYEKIKEEKDGKISINDTEVTIELVEGEDEKIYFKKVKADKKQSRIAKHAAGRRNKRKGYQGNRGRGSFRRSNRLNGSKRSSDGKNEEEPEAKQMKPE